MRRSRLTLYFATSFLLACSGGSSGPPDRVGGEDGGDGSSASLVDASAPLDAASGEGGIGDATIGDGGGDGAGPDAATADATAHDAAALDASAHDAGLDSMPLDAASDASEDSAAKDAATGASDAAAMPPCFVDAAPGTSLVDAIDVSIGADIACAVRQNGSLVCWGGETGGSVPSEIAFPADAGSIRITRVVVASRTVCALDTTGAVWCLGSNYAGQLGNGTPSDNALHPGPTRVVSAAATPITAVDISGGVAGFACALTAAGEVLCWGDDTYLELGADSGIVGDSGMYYSSVAVPVPGVTLAGGRLSTSAGGYSMCGTTGTTVACWGRNNEGESASTAPSPALNTTIATSLTAAGATLPIAEVSDGTYHSCAIDHAGQLFCWGYNASAERGVVDAGVAPNAVPSLPDGGASSVALGDDWTCFVDPAEHARCFGANSYGSLGVGDAAAFNSATPLTVVGLDGGGELGPVARVYAGASLTCAILTGACGPAGPGQVVCWGYGPDVSTTSLPTTGVPVALPMP